MRKIPQSHKDQIAQDPYFSKCARAHEGNCGGRITIEHAWIYAGRQINEMWAYVPICAYHHEVDEYQDDGDLNKELNQFISLSRATDADLAKYPKKDWRQIKNYLNEKYKDYIIR